MPEIETLTAEMTANKMKTAHKRIKKMWEDKNREIRKIEKKMEKQEEEIFDLKEERESLENELTGLRSTYESFCEQAGIQFSLD